MKNQHNIMKRGAGVAILALQFLGAAGCSAAEPATERFQDEALSFQSYAPWSPKIHLNADVAMVYGVDPSLPARIETWRTNGFRIHVMTGVSWGEYQDYLYGRFDGKNHADEAQTRKDGSKMSHGGDVYYMCPAENYGKFLCVGVKRALDAGAEAIHLEEPEFWAEAGWSEGFKREWKAYYNEEWRSPDSSPDAQYRASKLKYFLYRRALSQVFAFVKEYGQEHHRQIRCYVPTHSLLSYAQWRIVSPESSLLKVGCDGYIAQVWTGTARSPNVYENRRIERTFETAFLEYGAMQNLARASGRRVWYLNDPVEDDPEHSWEDYRGNWESTLTASLLQPEVWRYEIMPWPDRVFDGKYPAKDKTQRKPGEPVERLPMPSAYATELQTVVRALGEMKQPARAVRWERSGTRGVGVLVSDTLMFQRAAPQASDAHLGSFYGLAMPLLNRGLPVEAVQIETADQPGCLPAYRLLLLTYEGQKPPGPAFHETLAAWVRAGGALVVVDNDADPYHAVREWWNTAPMAFQTPRQHLFKTLGLADPATGVNRVGKGIVLYSALSPAALTYQTNGASQLRALCAEAAQAIKLPWKESSALVLRRGPYVVAGGLKEAVTNGAPTVVKGRYINLYDANLPILKDVPVLPAERMLLYDINYDKGTEPRVLAAACRVTQFTVARETVRFQAEGNAETTAVVRMRLDKKPQTVTANGVAVEDWDYADSTLRFRFPNSHKGVRVEIKR
jgi:hypothetical protein